MRTLLRAVLCAAVIGLMGGCGKDDGAEIPKKFAPMPKEVGGQLKIREGGPKAPKVLPKPGAPGSGKSG